MGEPELRMPCPIGAQSPMPILKCAETQIRHDAGEFVRCNGPSCPKYLVGRQETPDLDDLIEQLTRAEQAARAGKPSAFFPLNRPGQAAVIVGKDTWRFSRPLPPEGRVTRNGRVWKRGAEMAECPKCPTGWMSVLSQQCGACRMKELKAGGLPARRPKRTVAGPVAAQRPPIASAVRAIGEAIVALAAALEADHFNGGANV